MKKLLSIFLMLIFAFPAFGATFQGGVAEQGTGTSSRIIDKQTGQGVGGANIHLPKQNYSSLRL